MKGISWEEVQLFVCVWFQLLCTELSETADKESNWAIQRINKQETNLQKNNINVLPCKYQALVIFFTKFISEIY